MCDREVWAGLVEFGTWKTANSRYWNRSYIVSGGHTVLIRKRLWRARSFDLKHIRMLFLYFRIASCTVYLDRRQATTTNALPTPCGGKLRRYVDLGWCSRSGKNLFCHRHTLLSRGASVPLYSLVVQLVHYFHYSRAVALAVFFLSNSQSSLILLFSYY